MKRLGLLIAATVLALSGCVVHRHDSYYARSHSHRHSVCVHDDGCGHAWDGATWVYVGRHRHHHGCGHYWHGSRWCLDAPRRVVARHCCDASCGHYWDGGSWVVVSRHRHGPRCGHVMVNGYWSLRIR